MYNHPEDLQQDVSDYWEYRDHLLKEATKRLRESTRLIRQLAAACSTIPSIACNAIASDHQVTANEELLTEIGDS